MNRDVPDTPGVRATRSLALGGRVFALTTLALGVLCGILMIASIKAVGMIDVSPSGQIQLDPLSPILGVSAYVVAAALGVCDGVVLGLVLWLRPALLLPGTFSPRLLRWRRFVGPTLVCCGVWIIAFEAMSVAEELWGVFDGVFWGFGRQLSLMLANAPLSVVMIVALLLREGRER